MKSMRILPECITCIIDDILEALKLLNASHQDVDAITTEVLKYLADHYPSSEPPSYFITEMHRILKRRLNLVMPFSELREICLTSCKEVAAAIAPEADGLLGLKKMRFLMQWTIAANALDFRTAGAGYSFASQNIERMLREYFNAGLTIDDSEKIFDRIKNARSIVYVPDNVGELPFDKMLLAEFATYGAKIIVPFRGGPITSDVVMADAEAVKLDEVADEIILSGPDTLGVSFKEMTDEFKAALADADVIIGKGQANFYVLSEYGEQFPKATIISLFVSKCRHVSKFFGTGNKINIAAIIKEPGGNVTVGKETV